MFPSWSFCLFLGAATICHASAVPGHQQIRRQDGPVPPDTVKDCTYFYDSQPGDTCASIARDWGITLQQFLTYNPSVKPDCSGLSAGNAYCVEENYGNDPVAPSTTSSTPPTTSTPTTTTPTPTGPSPVQSGINAQCTTPSILEVDVADAWHRRAILQSAEWRYLCWHCGYISHFHITELVSSSITISSGIKLRLESAADAVHTAIHGILRSEMVRFYAYGQDRTPLITSEACQTLLLDYYVCVGVPGTPTAPPTTTSAGATPGPSPTQSGLVSTCTTF